MIKRNIKMRVNPEQSKKVQEICFENGIDWDGTGKFYHLNEPFIYIYELSISYDNKESIRYFRNHENKEIDADLFIRTNGTCEEDIYNINDTIECIKYCDNHVTVGKSYKIEALDDNKRRVVFLDDELDTRSIEFKRLSEYFKKNNNQVIDNNEDVYKGLNTTGFINSGFNKVVKEQCQKISKEIMEAQTPMMCRCKYIQLKKKIENLHIALKKKVEKNKNQKEEITRLLNQKQNINEATNIVIEFASLISKLENEVNNLQSNLDYKNECERQFRNDRINLLDENRILKDKNSFQVHRIENLEVQLEEKDTIIKYLEDRLNEK